MIAEDAYRTSSYVLNLKQKRRMLRLASIKMNDKNLAVRCLLRGFGSSQFCLMWIQKFPNALPGQHVL
jgi:hypothetical protein